MWRSENNMSRLFLFSITWVMGLQLVLRLSGLAAPLPPKLSHWPRVVSSSQKDLELAHAEDDLELPMSWDNSCASHPACL